MNAARLVDQSESARSLTLVIPTLNEADNVRPLIDALERELDGVAWTAIFVDDDSEDGTSDRLGAIAAERSHVIAVRRLGQRGLSSACIEGMAMAKSAYVAVLDADLQHDERLLRPMLDLMHHGRFDLVAASRFMPGASAGPLSRRRLMMSKTANFASARLCGVRLSDPMSGFFMIRRALFQEVGDRLTGHGTKILLDIVTAAGRPLDCAELPLRFRERLNGQSKLDAHVVWEFLRLLRLRALHPLAFTEPDRPVARL